MSLGRQSCAGVGILLAALAAFPAMARAHDGVAKAPVGQSQRRSAHDRPFRGAVSLDVDATDTDHRVFTVRETIPVQSSGDIVLLYPEWETASHAPTASAVGFAGLTVTIDGRGVDWQRDPLDVHAFRIRVPNRARLITVEFEFLAPRGAALLRRDMVDVQWQRLLLYPAGWYPRDIPVKATLKLAPGLHAVTALPIEASLGDGVAFKADSLEHLIDAPVYAARYWRTFDLTTSPAQPVVLDVVADAPEDIAPSARELDAMREMVTQTTRVFGAAPYRRYDAIVSLSDELSPGGGIEHLEEGENNLPADYFTDSSRQLNNRDLIAHELVHAWNGRFREPAGMRTPDYNTSADNSLLWVYEGQTEFWGRVMAARSGLRSAQETLDKLALDAAVVANRAGRIWKPLEDSTNDPVYMAGHPVGWRDWQRREDYYSEGVLLWLDVDARLRELTEDRRSLDDFAHRFFATHGSGVTQTYTFEEVCAGLAAIAPEDWSQFLRRHLRTHDTAEALAGLARSGWRLVYDTAPSETFRQDEAGGSNLDYSIGLKTDEKGVVESVVWQGPAFAAGLAAGDRIVSVNEESFSVARLQTAIRDAGRREPELEFDDDGKRQNVQVHYSGTLRYPRLEPIAGKPDRLSALLASR